MKTSVVVLVAAGDMSANITSNPFRVENMDLAAFQLVYAGAAPTGTLKLQASCDVGGDTNTGPAGFTATNWSDVPTYTQAVSATGSTLWNLTGVAYRWLRVVYTFTSGTGSLLVTANAKGRA